MVIFQDYKLYKFLALITFFLFVSCSEENTAQFKISQFFGTDDSILYTSCFDANGGLFETLLSPEDAVISDALNHASIIDGIRLCKAQRYRYANSDMSDLEAKLKDAQNARLRLIATDGVFSMDGTYAKLDEICSLANEYEAPVLANIPLSRVIRETSDAGAPISAVDNDGSVAAAYRAAAAAVMATLSGGEAPRGPTISMTE